MLYLNVGGRATCVPSAWRGLKRGSGPLELELERLQAALWALGTEPRSSAKIRQCVMQLVGFAGLCVLFTTYSSF